MNKEELRPVDLSTLQKVWAWDNNESIKTPAYFLSIVECHTYPYKVIFDNRQTDSFKNCTPYTEPKTRLMTHPEIFKAIREGAVVKAEWSGSPTNIWHKHFDPNKWQICYNFTDSESDKWEEMVVEE